MACAKLVARGAEKLPRWRRASQTVVQSDRGYHPSNFLTGTPLTRLMTS